MLDQQTQERFTDYAVPFDVENGIVIERTDKGVGTNVSHLVVQHSPDGFEFGYGGSGPADLALNICEMILQRQGHKGPRTGCFNGECFRAAYSMHQEFKWLFISSLPQETGGVLSYTLVETWVMGRCAMSNPAPATLTLEHLTILAALRSGEAFHTLHIKMNIDVTKLSEGLTYLVRTGYLRWLSNAHPTLTQQAFDKLTMYSFRIVNNRYEIGRVESVSRFDPGWAGRYLQ